MELHSRQIGVFPSKRTRCLRLDGGFTDDEGTSSSASRARLRRVGLLVPRLAAAMFGRKGELSKFSDTVL